MKQIHNIYTEKNHIWSVVTRDPDRPSYIIDTNECLITSDDESILTDPGGMEIFPAVFSAISTNFNPRKIKTIFASHQDPDIISSLALWLEVNPEMKCYISRLWTTFVPHFGGNDKTFIPLADEGTTIQLGSIKLQCIPAHYLHSAGNFHLYDQQARVYFSGDIGAALLESAGSALYVKNFDEHIKSARGFHERWMGSNEARLNWCERVSELEIDMMIPQHGSIYQGKDVKRFIDWFSELKVGLFTMGPDKNDDQAGSQPNLSEEVKEPEPRTEIEPQVQTSQEAENDGHTITDHSDLQALMENNPVVNGSSASEGESNDKEKPKQTVFSRIKDFFRSKK